MVANHIGQSLSNTCIFDVHSYIQIKPHTTQIHVSNHYYVQVRYMFLRQRSKMKRKKSRHCGQYFGQPLIICNRHVSMLFGTRGDSSRLSSVIEICAHGMAWVEYMMPKW